MNTKRWVALIIAVVLVVVSIGFKVVTTFTTIMLSEQFNLNGGYMDEEVIQDGDAQERIAVLNLSGTIEDTEAPPLATPGYNHGFLLDSIDTAAEDPTVQAIV